MVLPPILDNFEMSFKSEIPLIKEAGELAEQGDNIAHCLSKELKELFGELANKVVAFTDRTNN